jgi:hypothetical protein
MMLAVLTGWVEVGHYLEFCPTLIKIELKIVPYFQRRKKWSG